MDALTAIKYKSRADDRSLLQSIYSRAIAETIKKGVSDIKQKKRTPPLNSAYLN